MADARSGDKGKIVTVSVLFFFLGLLLTAYSSKNPDTTRVGSSVVQVVLSPVEEGAGEAFLAELVRSLCVVVARSRGKSGVEGDGRSPERKAITSA